MNVVTSSATDPEGLLRLFFLGRVIQHLARDAAAKQAERARHAADRVRELARRGAGVPGSDEHLDGEIRVHRRAERRFGAQDP